MLREHRRGTPVTAATEVKAAAAEAKAAAAAEAEAEVATGDATAEAKQRLRQGTQPQKQKQQQRQEKQQQWRPRAAATAVARGAATVAAATVAAAAAAAAAAVTAAPWRRQTGGRSEQVQENPMHAVSMPVHMKSTCILTRPRMCTQAEGRAPNPESGDARHARRLDNLQYPRHTVPCKYAHQNHIPAQRKPAAASRSHARAAMTAATSVMSTPGCSTT